MNSETWIYWDVCVEPCWACKRRTFVGIVWEDHRITHKVLWVVNQNNASIQWQGENAKSCADHMDKEVANTVFLVGELRHVTAWLGMDDYKLESYQHFWKIYKRRVLTQFLHLQFVKCRKRFSCKSTIKYLFIYIYIHPVLERFWTPQSYVDSVETGLASCETSRPLKESQRWSTCIYALRMVDVSGCRKETDGLILSRSWGGLTMFNSKTGLAISY